MENKKIAKKGKIRIFDIWHYVCYLSIPKQFFDFSILTNGFLEKD